MAFCLYLLRIRSSFPCQINRVMNGKEMELFLRLFPELNLIRVKKYKGIHR